ncbi:MAG TPA: hypothetical protein VKU19_26995 [Bryobacteraceae bacterium]|nr:hypothetical protein [Bryobacteraceae bacterium]
MNTGDHEMDQIRQLLQTAVPPWRDQEPPSDLWPRMLRRMEDAPPQFGWFEIVLAGAIVLTMAVFPQLLPVLFYQL